MSEQNKIKDSGDRTAFSTGAVRDMHSGKGRMDLLPWNAVIEVSKHCEAGALKYGEHNVDKGIPVSSLCDSGMRHLAKFIAGHDDEDHLRAAAWNILWALEMVTTRPDMMDIYAWRENGKKTDAERKNNNHDAESISGDMLPLMERMTNVVRGAVAEVGEKIVDVLTGDSSAEQAEQKGD